MMHASQVYFTLYTAENKLISEKYYITGDGCRRDKVAPALVVAGMVLFSCDCCQ